MIIQCQTGFDITRTDTRGHFSANRLPQQDRAGQWMRDIASWNRSRNQQRNLDTVLQIISLRTLPEDITDPVMQEQSWRFRFRVPDPWAVAWGADPVGALRYDAHGVPIVGDPGQDPGSVMSIQGYGPRVNILFQILDGK